MHAVKLLHNRLKHACPSIHKQRLKSLMDATQTLSENHHLSITGIGRDMNNGTSAKHNIKRVDRLVGNAWLNHERLGIYAELTSWLLRHQRHPIILVDWSDLTDDRQLQLLRASIPIGGRSLTIDEEVHSIHKQANPKVHQPFLNQLKQLLPKRIQPIIVTDAGFRGTWFKLVNQLHWHWVGRVRNRDFVQLNDEDIWQPCKDLYAMASSSPKRVGAGWLSRAEPNAVTFYVYKKPKQGRVAKSKLGKPICNSRHYKLAKREREPWLIVTSPSLNHLTAKQVISIYTKRMQIEEGFRDIKYDRYGLGLKSSLTKTKKRLEILLLLGMLALMLIWMVGISAIQQGIDYRYQSNTLRARRVLSSIFMRMQIMRHNSRMFTKKQLLKAFDTLPQQLCCIIA